MYEYATCRTLGHAWDRQPARYTPSAPVWKFKLEFRCERCGMIRRDVLDAYGDLVPSGRSYKQPPGYRYAADERPSAAFWRLMMMRRNS